MAAVKPLPVRRRATTNHLGLPRDQPLDDWFADALQARRKSILTEMRAIDDRYIGRTLPASTAAEWRRLHGELDVLNSVLSERHSHGD